MCLCDAFGIGYVGCTRSYKRGIPSGCGPLDALDSFLRISIPPLAICLCDTFGIGNVGCIRSYKRGIPSGCGSLDALCSFLRISISTIGNVFVRCLRHQVCGLYSKLQTWHPFGMRITRCAVFFSPYFNFNHWQCVCAMPSASGMRVWIQSYKRGIPSGC